MATKRRKEPLHAIFYQCSERIPDAAWSEFLKECSFGKFPQGIRFENGSIKCNRKGTNFSQALPKDVDRAVMILLEIFRDRLGIKTAREIRSRSIKFEKAMDENRICSWKQATTKGVKSSLIGHFGDRYAAYYGMTSNEHRDLMVLLNGALATKIIGADQIHMEGGQITSIDGLTFDVGSRKSLLEGKLTKVVCPILTVPIHFPESPGVDYLKKYAKLLDHHQAKTTKAHLYSDNQVKITQFSLEEPVDDTDED